MSILIDSESILRVIRALENLNPEKGRKIEVGKFKYNNKMHGIRVQKVYHSPDQNVLYEVMLDLEMDSYSGMVYVPIASFSSLYHNSFNGFTPTVRIDSNWVTCTTSINHNRTQCSVSVAPRQSMVNRKIIDITGDCAQDFLDDYEQQVFQYNLICDNIDAIDEQFSKGCLEFVFKQFQAMYDGAEITAFDLMPTRIKISTMQEPMPIPYDVIAQELEKYVQGQNQ